MQAEDTVGRLFSRLTRGFCKTPRYAILAQSADDWKRGCMDKRRHTEIIKTLAAQAGFAGCGIARAERLGPESSRLGEWLNAGYHGEMAYIADHSELRCDPRNNCTLFNDDNTC